MRAILAALLAACASYYANSLAVRHWGPRVILFGVPLIEEVQKTGIAWLIGAPILATHVGFGVVEAVYDWQEGSRPVRAPAVVMGLIGHAFFGWLTEWVTGAAGQVWVGLLAAMMAHLLWNTAVLGHWLRD